VKDDMRYVVGGAAAGAILGALAGWVLGMRHQGSGDESGVVRRVDSGRMMRLGWAVIGVIRQVLELG